MFAFFFFFFFFQSLSLARLRLGELLVKHTAAGWLTPKASFMPTTLRVKHYLENIMISPLFTAAQHCTLSAHSPTLCLNEEGKGGTKYVTLQRVTLLSWLLHNTLCKKKKKREKNGARNRRDDMTNAEVKMLKTFAPLLIFCLFIYTFIWSTGLFATTHRAV